MSKIIQVSPCTDWYYLEWNNDAGKWTSTPVAAWGLTEDGTTVGLLPVTGSKNSGEVKYPHLVPAPALAGKFVHASKLPDKSNLV